jgi:hypothetical protein
VVHDVVEVGAEPVDVLAVERRDERRVDLPVQLVGERVAVVLDLDQPLADRLDVGVGQHELAEQGGPGDEVAGGPAEELEERVVSGTQSESHGSPSPDRQ